MFNDEDTQEIVIVRKFNIHRLLERIMDILLPRVGWIPALIMFSLLTTILGIVGIWLGWQALQFLIYATVQLVWRFGLDIIGVIFIMAITSTLIFLMFKEYFRNKGY